MSCHVILYCIVLYYIILYYIILYYIYYIILSDTKDGASQDKTYFCTVYDSEKNKSQQGLLKFKKKIVDNLASSFILSKSFITITVFKIFSIIVTSVSLKNAVTQFSL